MPPTILPEEIPANATFPLSSSKKWVAQVGLLFGLLLLNRWHRQVAEPLAVAGISTPTARAIIPRITQPEPLPLPIVSTALLSAARPEAFVPAVWLGGR